MGDKQGLEKKKKKKKRLSVKVFLDNVELGLLDHFIDAKSFSNSWGFEKN